jgi:hypothetical protein
MLAILLLNEDGDPVHVVRWNHGFMDLSVIEDQRAPRLRSLSLAKTSNVLFEHRVQEEVSGYAHKDQESRP